MQKRCLTCRKVPKKSLGEGESKESKNSLPPTPLWLFMSAWLQEVCGDLMNETTYVVTKRKGHFPVLSEVASSTDTSNV